MGLLYEARDARWQCRSDDSPASRTRPSPLCPVRAARMITWTTPSTASSSTTMRISILSDEWGVLVCSPDHLPVICGA